MQVLQVNAFNNAGIICPNVQSGFEIYICTTLANLFNGMIQAKYKSHNELLQIQSGCNRDLTIQLTGCRLPDWEQGCSPTCIVPILFNLFTADFPCYLKISQAHISADDCQLHLSFKSTLTYKAFPSGQKAIGPNSTLTSAHLFMWPHEISYRP